MSESPDEPEYGLNRLRAACARMVEEIDTGAGRTTIGFCVRDILSAVDQLAIDWAEDYESYVIVPREHVVAERERLLKWFDENFLSAGITRIVRQEHLAERLTAEDIVALRKDHDA